MWRRLAQAAAMLVPSVWGLPDDDPGRRARIASMYAGYAEDFPDVEAMAVEELRRRQEAGEPLVLVDVRPQEERKVAILPGAIPHTELDPSQHRGSTVVVYCTIGARSGAFAQQLREEGYGDVYNLEGGLLAWTHIGGPLVDEDGRPTRRVHVYGPRWNLVAEGYEGVVTRGGEVVPL